MIGEEEGEGREGGRREGRRRKREGRRRKRKKKRNNNHEVFGDIVKHLPCVWNFISTSNFFFFFF